MDQRTYYETTIQKMRTDYDRQLSEAASAATAASVRVEELERTLQTQDADYQARLLDFGNTLTQERGDLARVVASNRRYSHDAIELSRHIGSVKLENAALIERNTSLNDKNIVIAQHNALLVQQVNQWETWGKETYNMNTELVNENCALQRQLHDLMGQPFVVPSQSTHQVFAAPTSVPLQPVGQQYQQPQLDIAQASHQYPQPDPSSYPPKTLSPGSKENQVPSTAPSTMVVTKQVADSLWSNEHIQDGMGRYITPLQRGSLLLQPNAASYGERVKQRLNNRPHVFEQFINALSLLTSTDDPQPDVRPVVAQVSQVLQGHDDLIAEFKYFIRYLDPPAAGQERPSSADQTSQSRHHGETEQMILIAQSMDTSAKITDSEGPGTATKRKSEGASPDEPVPKKVKPPSLTIPANSISSTFTERSVLQPAAPPCSPMTAYSTTTTEPSSALSRIGSRAETASAATSFPQTPVSRRTSSGVATPPNSPEHTRTQAWQPTGNERDLFISWLKTYPLVDLHARRAAAAAHELQQRGWEILGTKPRVFAVPGDSEHFRYAQFGMSLLEEAYPA